MAIDGRFLSRPPPPMNIMCMPPPPIIAFSGYPSPSDRYVREEGPLRIDDLLRRGGERRAPHERDPRDFALHDLRDLLVELGALRLIRLRARLAEQPRDLFVRPRAGLGGLVHTVHDRRNEGAEELVGIEGRRRGDTKPGREAVLADRDVERDGVDGLRV